MNITAIVAAQEFHREPEEPVRNAVITRQQTAPLGPPADRERDEKQNKIAGRFIQLRRVHRNETRRERRRVFEHDSPRDARRLAITATGRETTEAADRMAQ